MTLQNIGAVEVLVQRVYPLDAEAWNPSRTEVLVEAGMYDVFTDGMTTFWMMRGTINQRGPVRLGDGLFALNPSDGPSEVEVVFPSKRFGPDEWAELIAGPTFEEGNPLQRLRLHLTPGSVS